MRGKRERRRVKERSNNTNNFMLLNLIEGSKSSKSSVIQGEILIIMLTVKGFVNSIPF
ncbi:hypothetical protein DM15PD_00010 [Aristophania vespae]|nr:hypothetical protein DM15PD_00010 [Aristophania vespae]